jgi:hypothetical protein
LRIEELTEEIDTDLQPYLIVISDTKGNKAVLSSNFDNPDYWEACEDNYASKTIKGLTVRLRYLSLTVEHVYYIDHIDTRNLYFQIISSEDYNTEYTDKIKLSELSNTLRQSEDITVKSLGMKGSEFNLEIEGKALRIREIHFKGVNSLEIIISNT